MIKRHNFQIQVLLVTERGLKYNHQLIQRKCYDTETCTQITHRPNIKDYHIMTEILLFPKSVENIAMFPNARKTHIIPENIRSTSFLILIHSYQKYLKNIIINRLKKYIKIRPDKFRLIHSIALLLHYCTSVSQTYARTNQKFKKTTVL